MNRQKIKIVLTLGLPLMLMVGYLIFIFLNIRKEEQKAKSARIIVSITNPHYQFVEKKKILKLLEKQIGGGSKRLRHDSIDKNKLERFICKNPFVEDAQVFRTVSNTYQVIITQRSPVMRIWTSTESYYLDKDGFRMPTGVKHPALVHVYRGQVKESFAIQKLLPFQKFLERHPFWSEMIDYVVVNSKEELILFLRTKSAKIYLGKLEKIDEKLTKLFVFINKVGKYKGLHIYETIDLRFDNQVVVKK